MKLAPDAEPDTQGFYGFTVVTESVSVLAEDATDGDWPGFVSVTFMRPDYTQLPGLYLSRDAAITLRESLTDALGLAR